MKKGLKKFLISAAAVLAVVVVADWTIGKVVDRMLPAISNQGQIGCTYFALNEVEYPVLVVGSSRAVNHYVPSILKDSLGFDVYNIGRAKCFISYNCCVIQSILDRYTPKIIIWETYMDVLSSDNDPLESLYPYYGKNKYVTECIRADCNWKERFPLVSNFYKYNSTLIRIVSRYMNRKSYVPDVHNGYFPIAPRKWTPKEQIGLHKEDEEAINNEKVVRFKNVLKKAKQKGVKLIIVNSPTFMDSSIVSKSERLMKEMCDSNGVTIMNFSQAEGIYDDIEYWNDYNHMNSKGAELYTKMLIEKCLK